MERKESTTSTRTQQLDEEIQSIASDFLRSNFCVINTTQTTNPRVNLGSVDKISTTTANTSEANGKNAIANSRANYSGEGSAVESYRTNNIFSYEMTCLNDTNSWPGTCHQYGNHMSKQENDTTHKRKRPSRLMTNDRSQSSPLKSSSSFLLKQIHQSPFRSANRDRDLHPDEVMAKEMEEKILAQRENSETGMSSDASSSFSAEELVTSQEDETFQSRSLPLRNDVLLQVPLHDSGRFLGREFVGVTQCGGVDTFSESAVAHRFCEPLPVEACCSASNNIPTEFDAVTSLSGKDDGCISIKPECFGAIDNGINQRPCVEGETLIKQVQNKSCHELGGVRRKGTTRRQSIAYSSKGNRSAEVTDDLNTRCMKGQWGGRFVHQIEEINGNFKRYSDVLSLEGVSHALDSNNGWIRTVFWAFSFVALGYFFFFLTLPLVQDFQSQTVVTTLDSDTGAEGLPYPIVTVCPSAFHRCDCLLWRKLHCRYRYEVQNVTWMQRFDYFGCWRYFHIENSAGEHPEWMDPKCEQFETENSFVNLSDPCGMSASDAARLGLPKEEIDFRLMYELVKSRESSPSGPYIRLEELMLYSQQYLDDNVFFFKSNSLHRHSIPQEWISYRFSDLGVSKLCAQLRPPQSDQNAWQRHPGRKFGITMIATGLTDDYPLHAYQHGAAAVDVHVDFHQDTASIKDEAVYQTRNSQFFPVAAGLSSSTEYSIGSWERYRGWGSAASQHCEDTNVPRDICLHNRWLISTAQMCNCSRPNLMPDMGRDYESVYGCDITPDTEQGSCFTDNYLKIEREAISFTDCPHQCNQRTNSILVKTTAPVSDAQVTYFQSVLNKTEEELNRFNTATLSLSLRSMDVERVVESPKVTIGELFAQIGGNLGLWCGLSLLTVIELVEFSIVWFLNWRHITTYLSKGKDAI